MTFEICFHIMLNKYENIKRNEFRSINYDRFLQKVRVSTLSLFDEKRFFMPENESTP